MIKGYKLLLFLIFFNSINLFSKTEDCSCLSEFKDEYLKASPLNSITINLFDQKFSKDEGCILSSDKFIGMAELMIPQSFLLPMNLIGWKTISVKEGENNASIIQSINNDYQVSFYPADKNTVVISCRYLDNQDYKFYPESDGEIIEHTYYTLSYNESHEQAEWVHYKLNSSMIINNISRTDNFKPDYKVSTGTAISSDYAKSGYDRGHLAPAADMKVNTTSMKESFLLSNISPQNPSFNRGKWKSLESLVRSWALTNEIYVTTAGVLNENFKKIGVINKISVPKYFYKIIFDKKNSKMIAFLMPNQKLENNLKDYVVTVDRIEKLTGIDFYSELNDGIEEKLESEISTGEWDFSSSINISSNSSSSSISTDSSTGSMAPQCKGIAKSTGKQCKNGTYNKNGYCYVHQSQSPDYVEKPKTNYIGRCNAITAKGTQCKRNASSGSRFCWQHN